MRSCDLDMDFGYVCTVTLTLEKIGQVGMKLWPGHDVNRRTDGHGDSYIPPKLCLQGVYNDVIITQFKFLERFRVFSAVGNFRPPSGVVLLFVVHC